MDNSTNASNTVLNSNLGYSYCAHRLPCGYCSLRGMMCTSAASFNPCRTWWDQVTYTTATTGSSGGTVTINNSESGSTTGACNCKDKQSCP